MILFLYKGRNEHYNDEVMLSGYIVPKDALQIQWPKSGSKSPTIKRTIDIITRGT